MSQLAERIVLSASGIRAGINLVHRKSPAIRERRIVSVQRAIRQSNGTDFGTGVMPVLGWRDGSTMYPDPQAENTLTNLQMIAKEQ